LSRDLLRKEPPPLLITNASMLEYMLIRPEDAPILDASRGTLRWIVLDEAHTYLGSAAAEMSLLLRRVVHAFGVSPKDLRFIATSATIGDESSTPDLQRFLADLAGIDPASVTVVQGQRAIPDLPAAAGRTSAPVDLDALAKLSPAERYDRMAALPGMIELRRRVTQPGQPPPDLAEIQGLLGAELCPRRAGHAARPRPGKPRRGRSRQLAAAPRALLPADDVGAVGLRPTHLRSPSRDEARVDVRSPLAFRRGVPGAARGVRLRGARLRARVSVMAAAPPTSPPARIGRPRRSSPIPAEGFEIDDESVDVDDDDEPPAEELGTNVLVDAAGPDEAEATIDPETGARRAGGVPIRFARHGSSNVCLRCRSTHSGTKVGFRPARLGAPFYLSLAMPAVLDVLAPEKHEGDKTRPALGKRILTFTDSRQGSARFAARTQLEAERNWLRAHAYHAVWAAVQPANAANLAKLEEDEAKLRAIPSVAHLADEKRAEIEAIRRHQANPYGTVAWDALERRLAQEPTVRELIVGVQRFCYEPGALPPDRIAKALMLRELLAGRSGSTPWRHSASSRSATRRSRSSRRPNSGRNGASCKPNGRSC
jgi:DEAD/DEAH box helicase domain-containing protein